MTDSSLTSSTLRIEAIRDTLEIVRSALDYYFDPNTTPAGLAEAKHHLSIGRKYLTYDVTRLTTLIKELTK